MKNSDHNGRTSHYNNTAPLYAQVTLIKGVALFKQSIEHVEILHS